MVLVQDTLEYINIRWNYIGTQLGDAIPGEAEGDQSGYSVSLSSDGTTVAIGAPSNDGNDNHSGHVKIYKISPIRLCRKFCK